MAIMVGLIILGIFAIPATAYAATGGTISGTIEFPTSAYLLVSVNESATSSESIPVSNLTIYAMNVNTSFVNITNPNPDGTYSITVPDNGLYQIYVSPEAVGDMSRGPNNTQIYQYPNREGTRLYLLDVEGHDLDNVTIKAYAPEHWVPPNPISIPGIGGTTPIPVTPTATPEVTATETSTASTTTASPGFMAGVALIGMVIAAAAIIQRKN